MAALELVQLPNGDIVLQRADGGGDPPLVTIRFSEESRMYLMDSALEVAWSMIQAGIETAARASSERVPALGESGHYEDGEIRPASRPRVLH